MAPTGVGGHRRTRWRPGSTTGTASSTPRIFYRASVLTHLLRSGARTFFAPHTSNLAWSALTSRDLSRRSCAGVRERVPGAAIRVGFDALTEFRNMFFPGFELTSGHVTCVVVGNESTDESNIVEIEVAGFGRASRADAVATVKRRGGWLHTRVNGTTAYLVVGGTSPHEYITTRADCSTEHSLLSLPRCHQQ